MRSLKSRFLWGVACTSDRALGSTFNYNFSQYQRTLLHKKLICGANPEVMITFVSTSYCRFTKEFIEQAVNNTNEFFGGLKINVPRLVFIHGQFDPYSRLGITNTTKGSNLDIILIKG